MTFVSTLISFVAFVVSSHYVMIVLITKRPIAISIP